MFGPSGSSVQQEFVDQLAQFECQIFGLDKPSLTGAIAFEGRTLLNLDDPLFGCKLKHKKCLKASLGSLGTRLG